MDTMVAILPVLLIVVYTLNAMVIAQKNYENTVEAQQKFDVLVSSADYLVNYGLAVKGDGKYYPNWIVELDLNTIKNVELNSGLKKLTVGFDADGTTCIYRVIAYGADKQIRKLYFCEG
jgi:hypothetical protein